MRLVIFTIAFFFVATVSIAKKENDQIKFSLRFTQCFKNDTINLKINNIPVFENKIVTTDQTDEVTNIYLFQDNDVLWIDSIHKIEKIKVGGKILVTVSINRSRETFELKLSDGNHILFDKCHEQGNIIGWRYLAVSQRKKSPIFD